MVANMNGYLQRVCSDGTRTSPNKIETHIHIDIIHL